jgi:hypothetical protein
MVLSKISEIGGVIIGSWDDEIIIPALGDGTTKAGMMVNINTAGQAVATDVNAVDLFTGIALPCPFVDMDTAITANAQMNVVIPQSGHLYGVFIVDLNLSDMGCTLIFTTTAGSLGTSTDVEATHVARTYRYDDGDTVGIVMWGE